MHYVNKKKKGEKHIGVIRPRIRVRNEISRFLRFLSSSTSRLPLLDLTPDSSSPGPGLLRAYFRSKRANTDRAVDPELPELKNREISFLTRILGRTAV